jgi:hypothetical protein
VRRRYLLPILVTGGSILLALIAWLVGGRADAAALIAIAGMYLGLKLLGFAVLQGGPERALLVRVHMRVPKPEELPVLRQALRDGARAVRTAQEFDLRVVDTPMVNAFVVGVAVRRRIVAFTSGMIGGLDPDELRAVIVTLLARTVPGPLRDEVREALAQPRTEDGTAASLERRARIQLLSDARAFELDGSPDTALTALTKTLAHPGALRLPADEWGWLFYRWPGEPDEAVRALEAERLAAAERAAATLAGNGTPES